MVEEWLSRTELLLGRTAVERLQAASVAVIGLGGVGGYCCEALARSGIGRLLICDADVITVTNNNRQLLAKSVNIGQDKVEVAGRRIKQINPHCEVIARKLFFHEDTADQIFSQNPELVVDAIDSLNPKLFLLGYCLEHNIPLITSMGAALRIDPTMMAVTTLEKVTNDRLGAKIRKNLRHRGFTNEQLAKIIAIYSKELPDLSGMGEADEDDPTHIRGRVRRPLGTISTVPAAAGLTVASTVLALLLKDIYPPYKELLPKGF